MRARDFASHLAVLLALSFAAAPGPARAAGGALADPSSGGGTDGPTTAVSTILATGFEAPDGFVLGPLEPQNGYIASGTNLPWISVSDLNPASGARHLRIIKDVTAQVGTNRIGLTPHFVMSANSPSQVRQMVSISNDGGATYDCVGYAPQQGVPYGIAWRVRFNATGGAGTGPGTILIEDGIGVYVDTGVPWIQGSYRELKVQFDPDNNQIRYSYGGVPIYTSTIWAATAVEQVLWSQNNRQLPDEHAEIDDLQWIDSASDPVPAGSTSWGRIKGKYRD